MRWKVNWDWLAPRRALRQIFAIPSVDPKSRPCLPAVEPLDDRILLSAVPASSEGGAPTPSDILITLLKGEIGGALAKGDTSLLQGELDALKIAAVSLGDIKITKPIDTSTPLMVKLTDGFIAIDEIFAKYTNALIEHKLTDSTAGGKHFGKVVVTALNDTFEKIDGIVQEIGGSGENNLLVPAVQKVRDAAYKLSDNLSLLAEGADGQEEPPVQTIALKLVDDFSEAQEGLLKLGEDVFYKDQGSSNGDINYIKIKLDEVLISSALTDPQTQDQLKVFAGSLNNVLIGLLQPAPNADGGLSIAGDTGGDVISS